MITTPFESVGAWVLYFQEADIPVLRSTMLALDALRDQAETLNAREISRIIRRDPLLALRVMAYIEQNRKMRQTTDITTIERALVMIGITPFFRDFSDLPLVEDHMKANPQGLLGLLRVINRSRRASQWARDWAKLRHDYDVDEITVATLLHDAAEILMWCFAPALALQVREMQKKDKALRSALAQQRVYGIRLTDLQLTLCHAWPLPELLTTLMNRELIEENPRAKTVALAIDLARHSANGWDDAALPDDYDAICRLLHVSQETLFHKLGIDTPPAENDPAAEKKD